MEGARPRECLNVAIDTRPAYGNVTFDNFTRAGHRRYRLAQVAARPGGVLVLDCMVCISMACIQNVRRVPSVRSFLRLLVHRHHHLPQVRRKLGN
jgi:hypothetical protein